MKSGHIYIMSNPWMPGVIKIGETKLVGVRQKSLSAANVPGDYRILYFRFCTDVLKAEKLVFNGLERFRVDTGKEFFRVNLKKARSLIDNVCYDINFKERLINNELSEEDLSLIIDSELIPASRLDLDIDEEN